MSDEAEKKPNIDLDAQAEFIAQWDRIQEERESALGAYRQQCAGFKEREKQIKKLAKGAGMTARGWNIVIKQRKLLAQLNELREDEDTTEDDIVTADMLLEKIGEDFGSFGLGAAAVDAARDRQTQKDDAVNSITDDEAWEEASKKQTADNVALLKSGIRKKKDEAVNA
jgi:hypothetical protein